MIRAPELLTTAHPVAAFACGDESLDLWLKQRAFRNQLSGASRVYVACDDVRVVGYYALATGGLVSAEATGAVRRNMPNPIPAMVLGRLAVDVEWQGRGLGADLLRDAVLRTVRVAGEVGVRVLLVHALNDRAAAFYLRNGFENSPLRPQLLMLRIQHR